MFGYSAAVAVIAAMQAEENYKAKIKATYTQALRDQESFKAAGARHFKPTKCPCCGSRTFVQRGTIKVCGYCRSEQ